MSLIGNNSYHVEREMVRFPIRNILREIINKKNLNERKGKISNLYVFWWEMVVGSSQNLYSKFEKQGGVQNAPKG